MTQFYNVYNKYNQLLSSFNNYNDAVNFLSELKYIINKEYETLYLFADKPTYVIVTDFVFISRVTENGGGALIHKKYYFNLKKIK